jgi:hypothetical protein
MRHLSTLREDPLDLGQERVVLSATRCELPYAAQSSTRASASG